MDKDGRIIVPPVAQECDDRKGQNINPGDWLPSSDLDKSESWRTVPEKKGRRREGRTKGLALKRMW